MTKDEIFGTDYEELVILNEWICKAIDEKDKEDRVKIWELSVDNFVICYGSSRESTLEVAEQIIKDERNKKEDILRVEVMPIYVRESEVDEHLEM